MKKTYILFGAVLVVLLLAFGFTKTYLHSLEDETKWKQRSAAMRAELDSLEQQLQTKYHETKAFASVPIDSEPKSIPTPVPESTIVTRTPELPAVKAQPQETSVTKPSLATAAEDSEAEPTPDELVLYRSYVQRRLSLPSVIVARDLAKAKEQILAELGRTYGVTPEQVLKIVDKVYEHRRKGSAN